MKSIANDLTNFIFALASDSQETNLTLNMRTKIMTQLESDLEASDALRTLNNAKSADEVMSAAMDAADYAAGMMIKFDKNREKAALLEYMETMKSSLEKCTDLVAGLHITCAVLFAANFKAVLHFPGKLTPRVIDVLKEKITSEVLAVVTEVQDVVMRQLSGHATDSDLYITKLQTVINTA